MAKVPRPPAGRTGGSVRHRIVALPIGARRRHDEQRLLSPDTVTVRVTARKGPLS